MGQIQLSFSGFFYCARWELLNIFLKGPVCKKSRFFNSSKIDALGLQDRSARIPWRQFFSDKLGLRVKNQLFLQIGPLIMYELLKLLI